MYIRKDIRVKYTRKLNLGEIFILHVFVKLFFTAVFPLYICKIGQWQTMLYVKNGSSSIKITTFLYISKP